MGAAKLLIPAKLPPDGCHSVATEFGAQRLEFPKLLKFLDICLISGLGSLEQNLGETLSCVTNG